ncbi:MAG: HD domain-containing protein [Rectinemataceae bacterium]|nr:HD domain-containing protein [Spirochaetaceae bacterium]
MKTITLDPELRHIADRLLKAGWQAYLVGGAVRDALLGRTTSDFDIATDAQPPILMKLFPKAIPTGIRHGTITVLPRSRLFKVEITTFRTEGTYSDGRRPDAVTFVDDITLDLSRRDFTINAMAVDLKDLQFIDPFCGKDDLRNRLIRAVGTPLDRFHEDGLRPLRAVRFAAQLGFTIEEATFLAMRQAADRLKVVSEERIRDEFSKIMLASRPSIGLRLAEASGLMRFMVPELLACRGVDQPRRHRHDVLDHLYAAADAVILDGCDEQQRLVLRLAALFHDIGKPATRFEKENGEPAFHGHETVSAEMTAAILQRLKYPNHVIDRVCHLIRHHMFNYEPGWTDAAVRRLIARVGPEHLQDLLTLRIADTIATVGGPSSWPFLDELQRRAEALLMQKQALSLKDLAIDGDDLAAIGVPRNRSMGVLLKELLDAVLEDPSLNTRDTLLAIAKAKYFHDFEKHN